jgi:hypothetical protein
MTALAHSTQAAVLTRHGASVVAPTAPALKTPNLVRSRIGPPPATLLRPVKPVDRGWKPGLALEEAGPFGFRIAQPAELAPAHAASEAIMGMPLAPVSAIAAAHARTAGTGWVHMSRPADGAGAGSGPEITGIILLLPLSEAGEADLREGRFQPRAPEPHQLCAPGDHFPAIYFWLFAGKDGRARRNIIRTCLAWRNGAYSHVRGYARAASVEGFRTMAALGFEAMPSTLSHLFFIDKRA